MKLFDFKNDVREEVSRISDTAERLKARNRLIADRLEADVLRAGWSRLAKGDVLPLQAHANIFVIGVTNWDDTSLRILSELAMQNVRHAVYLFNLDDVHSAEELGRVLPGAHLPTRTPIGAEYADGKLLRVAEGPLVAELIRRLG